MTDEIDPLYDGTSYVFEDKQKAEEASEKFKKDGYAVSQIINRFDKFYVIFIKKL